MPSADRSATRGHAGPYHYDFEHLLRAYRSCRRTKRNTASARAYEQDLEQNLVRLDERLLAGTWQPSGSICFAITRPKPREVHAAPFGDRVVHHLVYNRVAPAIEASFITDSCACIPGRGTVYAARRLERQVRSITQGGQRGARYLKCDVANFFVSIDKRILERQLTERITDPWWQDLALRILWQDPRAGVEIHGSAELLARVPPHKSLLTQPPHRGLPIGNLSSQFFANVYMDELDQFVKHVLRAPNYVRYVDDIVLLHESAAWLNEAHDAIAEFLRDRLALELNESKTIRQPVARGIDFVGHVIAPGRRTIRRRTHREALRRAAEASEEEFFQRVNSYFGLYRQAGNSHADRVQLARLALRRGHSVDQWLTKAYR